MPLHPQAQAFIDELIRSDAPGWSEMTPQEGRETFAGLLPMFGDAEPIHEVQDHLVAGAIPVRVYRNVRGATVPAAVYFHGGGWVLGDRNTHDALCRRLAKQSGFTVFAVDYRRAPEHKFPLPLDDCYVATQSIWENADEFHIDPNRIAVVGDSAGGNLAVGVSLKARDQGQSFVSFQLLIYPVLQKNFETTSYNEFAEGHGLTKESMIWFWRQYLAKDDDGDNPYAAPLNATDLRGLPATHVITAEYDVLRDEGEAFAARLAAANVPTTSRRYDGMIHGFTHMSGVFDVGKQSIDDIAKILKDAL